MGGCFFFGGGGVAAEGTWCMVCVSSPSPPRVPDGFFSMHKAQLFSPEVAAPAWPLVPHHLRPSAAADFPPLRGGVGCVCMWIFFLFFFFSSGEGLEAFTNFSCSRRGCSWTGLEAKPFFFFFLGRSSPSRVTGRMGTGATPGGEHLGGKGGPSPSFPFLQGAGEFAQIPAADSAPITLPPSVRVCAATETCVLMLFVPQTYALKCCRQGEVI